MSTELDFTDPLVLAMADRNHVPSERWNDRGELTRVVCAECSRPWPCATRVTLNELPAAGGES